MKKYLTLSYIKSECLAVWPCIAVFFIWLLAVGIEDVVRGQSTNAPVREINFNLNPGPSLNAARMRITSSEFNLDFTLKLHCEAWGKNGKITRQETVTISAVQLKAIINAANPTQMLKDAVRASPEWVDAGLTEKL